MKLKSILLGIFVCVLGFAFVLNFSGHLMAQQKAATKSKAVKKDADYWFNKGALVSTYGNNQAAVKYFQKAIVLNPNFSGESTRRPLRKSTGRLRWNPKMACITTAEEGFIFYRVIKPEPWRILKKPPIWKMKTH
jgi:tetratricopeptide (TPR) repeat protein